MSRQDFLLTSDLEFGFSLLTFNSCVALQAIGIRVATTIRSATRWCECSRGLGYLVPDSTGVALYGPRLTQQSLPRVKLDFEGMLEDARDPRRKAGPWMIVLQRATSPQQMTETGLMERVGKLAIRRPAVAPEAAREVRADH